MRYCLILMLLLSCQVNKNEIGYIEYKLPDKISELVKNDMMDLDYEIKGVIVDYKGLDVILNFLTTDYNETGNNMKGCKELSLYNRRCLIIDNKRIPVYFSSDIILTSCNISIHSRTLNIIYNKKTGKVSYHEKNGNIINSGNVVN